MKRIRLTREEYWRLREWAYNERLYEEEMRLRVLRNRIKDLKERKARKL